MRWKFIATEDVTPLIGVLLAGATNHYVYQIESFNGKRGFIEQSPRTDGDSPETSIKDTSICLLDYEPFI